MLVMQYRSLVDLESRTQTANREFMQQTLQCVARAVKAQMDATAAAAFSPVSASDLWSADDGKIELHFAAVKNSHPEIKNLFAVSACENCADQTALVYTENGFSRITAPNLSEDHNIKIAAKAFEIAVAQRDPLQNRQGDLIYWQGACSACSADDNAPVVSFVFRPLYADEERRNFTGFLAAQFDGEYLKKTVLPAVAASTLQEWYGQAEEAGLSLLLLDENQRETFTTGGMLRKHETTLVLNPVFPSWQLAAGYKGITVEELAHNNFQKSVLLLLFVVFVLLVGIFLIFRVTARELKLAEAKSSFVSNVSHELKTPLALIRLFAETLELGHVREDGKRQEYYRIINNESLRLTKLIENILDFSKIEAGRKQYSPVKTDLVEIVDDVLKSYEYQIKSGGFLLEVKSRSDLPEVFVDREAIVQALLNLLANAVKYSPDAREITVRLRSGDDYVAIDVIDRGIGIARSEQRKIFEKFYRVSDGLRHDTKGSGLGLALVKHIVAAHGGRVEVESAIGKGSRFTIWLPAHHAPLLGEEENDKRRDYAIA